MKKYFIGFGFEEKLENKISEQKALIRNLAGEQKYLSDPPHSTIIILTLEDLSILNKLEEISKKIKKLQVEISGFHVFYNDVFTGNHSVVYSFKEEDAEKLRKLQVKIIDSINNYNTKQFFKLDTITRMSDVEKSNLSKYGFPFIGSNWIPHITLASIDKDKFEQVFSQLKDKEIKGNFQIKYLDFYEIEPIKLIKRFELA